MLDEPGGRALQVMADDGFSRRGPAALDRRKQRTVLGGELADGGVSLYQLSQAQEDLAPERFMSIDETSIPGARNEGAMEREIGFDDHPLRGADSQSLVMRKRTASRVRHGSTRRECPCRLDFDRRSQLVNLTEILGGQRADEDSTVACLGDQPSTNEPVERGAERVPTDLELLGEVDLAEVLPWLKAAVQHLSGERFLE
jgi:hypothetical protein